jgi:hypothetical protein
MALITDINQVLRSDPGNVNSYLHFIQSNNVTPAERRFVLKDRSIMARLLNALGVQQALAVTAALMDGCFEWRGPGWNGFYMELSQRFIQGNVARGLQVFMQRNPM